MRCLIVFLVVFLSSASPAAAIDALLGRVVSVDIDGGRAVVDVSATKKQKQITVVVSDKKALSALRLNMLVRLWGDWQNEGEALFTASQVGPETAVDSSDPTGVRKRLRRSNGSGQGGNRQGWRHGGNTNRRH